MAVFVLDRRGAVYIVRPFVGKVVNIPFPAFEKFEADINEKLRSLKNKDENGP